MLLLANQSHALFTSYMVDLSNGVAQYALVLTNAEDRAEARALARALAALKKPSESVAQDYSRFFTATLRLGRFAFTDPNLLGPGTNVFILFMNDAAIQIGETAARIDALNRFVPTKRAASNQLAQAQALLIQNATETNLTAGLLRGLRIFSKLVNAQRLTTIGENNQGVAPESVAGQQLNFVIRGEEDGSAFFRDTDADLTLPGDTSATTLNYTYSRTGLNTGKAIFFSDSITNTVTLKFRAEGEGRFIFRQVGEGGRRSGSGLFTLVTPAG
jgi:hypothetical protein